MRRIQILTLAATLAVSGLGMSQEAGDRTKEHPDLEKQLWQVEQEWLDAARSANADFLRDLWSDKFFEISMWPPGDLDKTELLDRVSKRGRGDTTKGPFPSEFKLRAVYGNVAIATDRTTVKGRVYSGRDYSGEYEGVRFFVKENGKWRVAGSALVPKPAP